MELELQGKLATEGLDTSAQPASTAVQRKVKWTQAGGQLSCLYWAGHGEELCLL